MSYAVSSRPIRRPAFWVEESYTPEDPAQPGIPDVPGEERRRLLWRLLEVQGYFASALSLRPPSVEERFRELAEAWRQGVGPTSSIAELAMHPAYQRIIGLGPGVVPLLLRELKERPAPWIWALEALTGVDPLGPAEKWTFEEVVQAWLKWGREEGFIE